MQGLLNVSSGYLAKLSFVSLYDCVWHHLPFGWCMCTNKERQSIIPGSWGKLCLLRGLLTHVRTTLLGWHTRYPHGMTLVGLVERWTHHWWITGRLHHWLWWHVLVATVHRCQACNTQQTMVVASVPCGHQGTSQIHNLCLIRNWHVFWCHLRLFWPNVTCSNKMSGMSIF